MSNQFNNVIETLPLVETIHPLDELNNYYAGWPGLLVGSGPSLTRDYGWIREHQKKLVVLAVDSTVSALVNQGIKPDFTISIDPQDENNVYVSNVEAEGALVASFSVSSQYFPWARGRPKFGFYLADDDEGQRLTSVVLEWLRQFISGRGSLQTGGSIATTGIDFLRLTGVDPICISGIDHCYTDHRAVAGGTRREELFVDALNRFESLPSKHLGFIYENIVQQGKELKYAQSREGETVVTMDEYEVQNHWFEQASDVLASQCLDFRADGLPMDGWTAVSSPGEYIDHHFKQSIPELNSEEFSTFEVDWESLESSVEDLLEVCPDEFSGFEATLQSADWPDHDFWTVFVRPLKDYLAMGNEPRDEVEIETYYRDLRQCLVELGRVVRQQS